MVIENQTNVPLYVDGRRIDSNMARYSSEHIFDTANITSDIGSIKIVTEYCMRTIECSGNIVAYESAELDDNGHKIIVVKVKDNDVSRN